jgi:hypothetical protein
MYNLMQRGQNVCGGGQAVLQALSVITGHTIWFLMDIRFIIRPHKYNDKMSTTQSEWK